MIHPRCHSSFEAQNTRDPVNIHAVKKNRSDPHVLPLMRPLVADFVEKLPVAALSVYY
jgi:hypothetical protein